MTSFYHNPWADLSPKSARDEIADYDEEIILWDDCDEALVGIGERCSKPPVAVYDDGRLVECFVQRQGMSYEEAVEWVDFNIRGAWVGERTPIILWTGNAGDSHRRRIQKLETTLRAVRQWLSLSGHSPDELQAIRDKIDGVMPIEVDE